MIYFKHISTLGSYSNIATTYESNKPNLSVPEIAIQSIVLLFNFPAL